MPNGVTATATGLFDKQQENLQTMNKIIDEKTIGGGGISANESFKANMQKSNKGPQFRFDGGAEAQNQEAFYHSQMVALNHEASPAMMTAKEINEQKKLLMKMVIESFNNPDPEQEKDTTKTTQTLVQLQTAEQQIYTNQLMQEQNALLRHNNRIITEQRIGMKAQYQDRFLETQEGQESAPIFYRLGRDAVAGKATIRNKDGHIVHEIPLSALKKGDHEVRWDLSVRGEAGKKAKPDLYFIDFEATDKNKSTVEHIVELEGIISDIDTGENGEVEYYVGGLKIDGRISKISRNTNDTDRFVRALADIRDKPEITLSPTMPPVFESNPITPPLILENQNLTQSLDEVLNDMTNIVQDSLVTSNLIDTKI